MHSSSSVEGKRPTIIRFIRPFSLKCVPPRRRFFLRSENLLKRKRGMKKLAGVKPELLVVVSDYGKE
jgi:hypothetical protein